MSKHSLLLLAGTELTCIFSCLYKFYKKIFFSLFNEEFYLFIYLFLGLVVVRRKRRRRYTQSVRRHILGLVHLLMRSFLTKLKVFNLFVLVMLMGFPGFKG